MKKNKPFIKVPKDGFKRANDKGILEEYLFFLILKPVNIEGKFNTKERNKISSLVKYSKSYTNKLIRSCIELGFIREEGDILQLSNYDKSFEILGYNLDNKDTKTFNIRKGNFKIFKIKGTKNIKQVLEREIFLEEIKLWFAQQLFMVRKKLKKNKGVQCRNTEEYKKTIEPLKLIEFNFLLSVRSLAYKFGYSSASKGHSILKDLILCNLLKVVGKHSVYECNIVKIL